MDAHGNVVFGGDGYSSQWHRMAVEEIQDSDRFANLKAAARESWMHLCSTEEVMLCQHPKNPFRQLKPIKQPSPREVETLFSPSN